MSEQVIADLTFEIEQIDQLLEKYTGLLENTEKGKPSLIEVAALGSVLHSFYNGLENIFTTIARIWTATCPTARSGIAIY